MYDPYCPQTRPDVQRDIIGSMDGWFTFSYHEDDLDPSAAFPAGYKAVRPIACVSLSRGGKSVEPFWSVLDTGADFCVFPSKYLEVLGIERSALKTAPVFGLGSAEVPFAEVTLEISGLGKWAIYAGFADLHKESPLGLISQSGFFDRYTILFDYRARCCAVTEESNV